MKIKNLVALILAVLLTLSLSGCASSSVLAGVNDDGKFVYAVVRAAESNSTEENVAKEIRSAIKDNFDCAVTILKDSAVEDYDGNLEILVGNTSREASSKALQMLKNNRLNHNYDFIVAVIDDKICIQAVENDMLQLAGDWFVANFCGSMEDFKKLTKNYVFIYESDVGDVSNVKIGGAPVGAFSTTLPRKCSYLVGCVAEEYRNFLSEYGFNVALVEEKVDENPEYELLFGECEAQESKNVKVEGDNYVIKVVGKKVVIKGGSDLATNRAAKAFLDEIKNAFKNNAELNWADGYTVNGKYNSEEDNAFILTWNDEFNGSSVDYTKWGGYVNEVTKDPAASCLGGKIYTQNVTGDTNFKGNLERDMYYVSDGNLSIGTMLVNDTDFIKTRAGTFSTMIFRYGMLEVYQKVADTPANSSLWVNGGNFNDDSKLRFGREAITRSAMTEIDLLENFGNPNAFASNVHRWWGETSATGKNTNYHNSMDGKAQYNANSDNPKRFEYTDRYGDMIHEDYHYYTFYWGPDFIKFAFDGKIYCDYQFTGEDSVSVHRSFGYFLTDCSMGDPAYGVTYNKDKHAAYLEHKLDFIRIYQIEEQNSQMITAWPEKQKNGTRKVVFPDNSIGTY